jgi:hypothetical protein
MAIEVDDPARITIPLSPTKVPYRKVLNYLGKGNYFILFLSLLFWGYYKIIIPLRDKCPINCNVKPCYSSILDMSRTLYPNSGNTTCECIKKTEKHGIYTYCSYQETILNFDSYEGKQCHLFWFIITTCSWITIIFVILRIIIDYKSDTLSSRFNTLFDNERSYAYSSGNRHFFKRNGITYESFYCIHRKRLFSAIFHGEISTGNNIHLLLYLQFASLRLSRLVKFIYL